MCKTFFLGKAKNTHNITLIEKNAIISKEKEVAETLNTFFAEAVKNLDITGPKITNNNKSKEFNDNLNSVKNDNDIDLSKDNRISDILDKYKHHPSIQKIRENVTNRVFSFNNISINEIEDKIKNIDIKKASSDDDIPAKIIIGCSDIVSPYIREIYDKAILNCEFPAFLKFADISPFHKKEERTKKENYRPISILPIISKIIERNMWEQISKFIDKNLSPYLSGFRKGITHNIVYY